MPTPTVPKSSLDSALINCDWQLINRIKKNHQSKIHLDGKNVKITPSLLDHWNRRKSNLSKHPWCHRLFPKRADDPSLLYSRVDAGR